MTIDQLLVDFPEEVKDAAARFQQGDVLEDPPMAHHACRRYPLTRMAEFADPELALDIVELETPRLRYGIITTQTCDVSEADSAKPRKPWIQLAPVYELENLSETFQAGIEAFGFPDFVRLTSNQFMNRFYVADLRLSLPFEKSILVGREPLSGFPDDAGRRAFADHCAAYINRPILSTLIHTGVVKHINRYFEKRDKLRQDARDAGVASIRLKIGGPPEQPVVSLLILMRADADANRDAAIKAFDKWLGAARKNAEQRGLALTYLGNRCVTLSEISAEEYLSSIALRSDNVL